MKYLLIVFALLPSLAFAGWSTTGKVTDIYSHNGTVLLTTEITDGPCPNRGAFWWPITDDDSDIMLSLVLVSFTTGKEINVVYNSDVPNCISGSFAEITHLRLIN